MSSSARIDELRKKFDENPRRFFAPLANEYRKAGDFEQAVFICQEYLPQQPGHMSGHIVYGQTLFDMGRDEEARAVFETALTLDPENLIALKHLGDIARQAGDVEGSRSWYQRVLEADPRNDEIMQILEAMGGVQTGAGAPPVPHDLSDSDRSPISFADVAEPASVAAGEAESTHLSSVEPSSEDEIEPLVLEQSVDAELPVAELAVAEVVVPELPVAESATVAEVETVEVSAEPESHELLDFDDFSIGGSDVAAEKPAEPESIATADSLDIAGFGAEPATEERAPDAVPEPEVELATDVILGLYDDTPQAPTSEPPVSELEVEPTTAAGEDLTRAIDQLEGLESFSMDPAVEAPSTSADEVEVPPAPDTFATETMAELYAQQGHLESALEIYGQLIERSPDDAELRRRAAEVERQLRGAPAADVVEPAEETITAAEVVEASVVADAAEIASPEYTGPTIRDFFREILEARYAEPIADVATPGEGIEAADTGLRESEGSIDLLFSDSPTAEDDLSAAMSLAEAFGQGEGDDSAALRGTPAHPASDELSLDHVFRAATPAKGSAAAGGFSLDQFFAGGSASPDTPESSSEAAPPRSSDDIAQFNAWLNGLKKT